MITKALKEATERELREQSEHPNEMYELVKSMKGMGKMLREELHKR